MTGRQGRMMAGWRRRQLVLLVSLGPALVAASSNSIQLVDDITQDCLETTTGTFRRPEAQGLDYFLRCLTSSLDQVGLIKNHV